MEDGHSTWLRRHELSLQAQRCDDSSKFILLATPLYLLFPVFFLAVIPVFIMIRRQRYLCHQQIERLRKRACQELAGAIEEDPSLAAYTQLVVDPFRRPR